MGNEAILKKDAAKYSIFFDKIKIRVFKVLLFIGYRLR